MNLRTSNYARLGILGLALAISPLALSAQMQDKNAGNAGQMSPNAATASMQNSDIVPGTGMTLAELRDLGYNQQDIAEIRNTDLNQNAGMSQNAATQPNAQTENTPVQKAQNRGSNWGWIGLFGLFGLLGLRGGHRAGAVREDRDIRRVA